MLIEIHSPAFKECGNERPPIIFGPGLNVILGESDGKNSIGKTTALLAIDFAFGGNTYQKSDAARHVGPHTIFFTFEFDGKKHRFARNTENPSVIFGCTEDFQLTGTKWKHQEFMTWLCGKYHIDYPGLTFRSAVGKYFRIYGKDNCDERRPLSGHLAQSMGESIEELIKLFNRYQDIALYDEKLDKCQEQLEAYQAARRLNFISNLVGGQEKYEENLLDIMALESDLENLINNQEFETDDYDIQKAQMKSQLVGEKVKLETKLQTLERRLSLVSMSMEYGLYPTEDNLSALQEFFPTVNIRKIYEVEQYHHKLASILDKQFSEERKSIEAEMLHIREKLYIIQKRIQDLGIIGNITKDFLDQHAAIKNKIDALKTQNAAYLKQKELQDAKKRAAEQLKAAIKTILADLENLINDQMKEYNDTLYKDPRKAPHLSLFDNNTYRFETPDDTGTGTNYKGLLIYDLSILALTDLPAIAHDSLLFSNLSYDVFNGIMRIYNQNQKQVFIAFDKQAAYQISTQETVKAHTVLRLSGNGHELYGECWNMEVPNEDEL